MAQMMTKGPGYISYSAKIHGKCKCCGKEFYYDPDQWVYKVRSNKGTRVINLCSWTCLNKSRKKEYNRLD